MNKNNKIQKTVDSRVHPLNILFKEKFTVDFYQREYVWGKKQLEDLINDLSLAFLENWQTEDSIEDVKHYDPYFMGEIIILTGAENIKSVIDGQQRMTTLTLLLIFLLHKYKNLPKFPVTEVENVIYSDDFGTPKFNLEISIRKECMLSLFREGYYEPNENDYFQVANIVDRYIDISESWNERINETNIVNFVYWLLNRVVFSKVSTNNDEFAYVIFETMNDRGLSLTPVEMLRSYLLANIDKELRNLAITKFDSSVTRLSNIKLTSKSKAEFEFFKVFFRTHYAVDLSQSKDSSDFVRIGNAFHRWVRENSRLLKLNKPIDYMNLINQIEFYSKEYERIFKIIDSRDSCEYFYLIVNADYGFTLQPALIISAINYNDADEVVAQKTKLITKYLSKVLTWRTWNHWMISQSSMEASVFALAKELRGKTVNEIESILKTNPLPMPELENSPILNQQNKRRLRVLLSLITEIVARESKESNYILNKSNIEVEHILADNFDRHAHEYENDDEFRQFRNNIGALLVLPKSFNASYGDDPYSIKIEQYYSQNILAQTLNEKKYVNNPDFIRFKDASQIDFKPYKEFGKNAILERAELYKSILLWNWEK